MFKGLLSKLRTKRSPLDPSDFIKHTPAAMSHVELTDFVYSRYFPPETVPPPQSEGEEQARRSQCRHMAFDLRYRCGAEGRCSSGAFRCRFPECFTMRPLIKGAEVFVERSAYEIDDAPAPDIQLVVEKARADKLYECIEDLQRLVDRRITAAGANFGKAGNRETQEAIGMMQWRAALLVNMREDEKAVSSLINFMRLLEAQMQLHAAVPAAQWAFFHDLEVLFYVRHCEEFPGFVPWREKICEDPMLLERVVIECRGVNKELLDYVAHHIFGKHVSAVVQRGETSQKYQESFEEPMKTTAVTDEIRYLRNTMLRMDVDGKHVWDRYIALATMPPMRPRFLDPPKKGAEALKFAPAVAAGGASAAAAAAQVEGDVGANSANSASADAASSGPSGGAAPGESQWIEPDLPEGKDAPTPAMEMQSASAAVVDAVGRSILCHHLAEVCKEHRDPALSFVVKRLKELLTVAKVGEQRLSERRQALLAEMEKKQLSEAHKQRLAERNATATGASGAAAAAGGGAAAPAASQTPKKE